MSDLISHPSDLWIPDSNNAGVVFAAHSIQLRNSKGSVFVSPIQITGMGKTLKTTGSIAGYLDKNPGLVPGITITVNDNTIRPESGTFILRERAGSPEDAFTTAFSKESFGNNLVSAITGTRGEMRIKQDLISRVFWDRHIYRLGMKEFLTETDICSPILPTIPMHRLLIQVNDAATIAIAALFPLEEEVMIMPGSHKLMLFLACVEEYLRRKYENSYITNLYVPRYNEINAIDILKDGRMVKAKTFYSAMINLGRSKRLRH